LKKRSENIFPSWKRLTSRRDYLRTWERGKKVHTGFFIIAVAKHDEGPTRLGVTASKKVGGAVQRNRVKRIVREFFRLNYQWLDSHTDLSIIAKKGSSALSYEEVYNELKKVLIG
jgi:ribonuclease P protein component